MASTSTAVIGPATNPVKGTPAALIAAALEMFAERGFEATSTRDIAAAANANIGSIAYHFGGKEGLRMACADAIVGRLSAIASPPEGQEEALVAQSGKSGQTPTADEAAARIEALIRAIFRFMVGNPESEPIAAFLLREMAHPSGALDRIYAELIAPVHSRLCRMWALATGLDPECAQTRIDVFALIGQAIYFRIGRPVVIRRLGWNDIGEPETEEILHTLSLNLHAQILARRKAPQ